MSDAAIPHDATPHDARSRQIVAKTIYRTLRTRGFSTRDVLAIAGALLGSIAREVGEVDQRGGDTP